MGTWVWWLVAAVVLGIIEVTTLDLVFAMLAAGAVAGGVVAVVGFGLPLQAAVAIVVAVAMLAVVRPIALRHLRTPLSTRTGTAALVGSRAVVLERVDAHAGQVKLAGEVWTARAYDEGQVIEAGQPVDVVEIKGATALVYQAEAPWQS
ncbi:NfeD family protein [soil metagenome]